MDNESLEEVIGALKSQARRQVIELLSETPSGLRFSEIARALSIYPSTLEKHLTKLTRSRLISHHDARYLSTVNSIIIWEKFKGLQNIDSESYFSSHVLLLDNPDLRTRFGSLHFEVIPNLISIINQIKNDFNDTQTLVQAGGNLSYQVGKGVYESGMLSHKNTRVELILTQHLIDQIQLQKEESLFLSKFDEKTTWLYKIEECSLGLGVGESSGFLFLPLLDFEVDYHQCLYTRSPDALEWLREVFGHLKAQSQIFNP